MDFDALKSLSASFKPIDLSRIAMPEPIYPKIEMPELQVIDPEDTIMGDIKRKLERVFFNVHLPSLIAEAALFFP